MMNIEQAVAILTASADQERVVATATEDALYLTGPGQGYVSANAGLDEVILEGSFSREKLEAILVWMQAYAVQVPEVVPAVEPETAG